MAGILFDTSVYIGAFRSGNTSVFSQRSRTSPDSKVHVPVWLSAVVLEELYAGAGKAKPRKLVARLEKDFENVNRLLVPQQSDWTSTGMVLNKIGQKFGFEHVGKARLTNDTLIAMTAARNGLTLLTTNATDFVKIESFRQFRWKLV